MAIADVLRFPVRAIIFSASIEKKRIFFNAQITARVANKQERVLKSKYSIYCFTITFKLTSNCNRYPKKYRHSLVDRIQLRSLDLYETLLEANRIDNRTRKWERCDTITRAITICDKLLFYIELSMRLELLADNSAEYWSKMVQDVKHMALAWRTKERQ